MYVVYAVLALCLTKLLEWLIRSVPIPELQKKYIVITGCDSGFGNLLAKKLDQKGVHVIACCYTPEGLNELEKNTSDKLRTLHLDVTSHESVEDCYQAVKKILPSDTGLWGLVNNAGVGSFCGPLDWGDVQSYTKVIKVNLLGVVDMTLTFLPLIYKAGGRVVNISSSYGRTAVISAGYSEAKFGVESFTDSLRMHFISIGSPCKVSVLNPAHFITGMTYQGGTYRNHLMERYSRLRPEVKAFYPSDWKAYIDKVAGENEKFLTTVLSSQLDPVVDAYIHALTSRWPKKRYTIGWDAYLIWVPFSYLPSCLTDRVICHLMNSGRRF